jgi:hypothetical protein
MDDRELARAYASGRVVIGVLALLFPGWMVSALVGGERDRVTKTLGRMLGVRDAVIGAGALVALEEEKSPLRPWMTYGAVADGVDVLAILLAFRSLPKWRRFLMLGLAIGGAATGGYLVTRFDD